MVADNHGVTVVGWLPVRTKPLAVIDCRLRVFPSGHAPYVPEDAHTQHGPLNDDPFARFAQVVNVGAHRENCGPNAADDAQRDRGNVARNEEKVRPDARQVRPLVYVVSDPGQVVALFAAFHRFQPLVFPNDVPRGRAVHNYPQNEHLQMPWRHVRLKHFKFLE